MVQTFSNKSNDFVSSKVAFFMQEQKKCGNHEAITKTSSNVKRNDKSSIMCNGKSSIRRNGKLSIRRNGKLSIRRNGKSSIKEKLAIFQKMERKAKEVEIEQELIRRFFEQRSKSGINKSKIVKPQIRQKDLNKQSEDFAIQCKTTKFGLGTILDNSQNGIVAVELGWGKAYINQDSLRYKSDNSLKDICPLKNINNTQMRTPFGTGTIADIDENDKVSVKYDRRTDCINQENLKSTIESSPKASTSTSVLKSLKARVGLLTSPLLKRQIDNNNNIKPSKRRKIGTKSEITQIESSFKENVPVA